MHSQDLINQFIELRARHVTYAQIATDLNINRNTALRWGQKHKVEIEALAAVEAEALRQKFLGSREDEIEMLSKRLQRLNAEVDKRNPGYMNNREIMALNHMTRARLDLLCAEPKLPDEPAQDSPSAASSPQN